MLAWDSIRSFPWVYCPNPSDVYPRFRVRTVRPITWVQNQNRSGIYLMFMVISIEDLPWSRVKNRWDSYVELSVKLCRTLLLVSEWISIGHTSLSTLNNIKHLWRHAFQDVYIIMVQNGQPMLCFTIQTGGEFAWAQNAGLLTYIKPKAEEVALLNICLLYTSDAADE